MNRLAAGLGVLVGALGIVCIALIIVVAVQSPPQQITQFEDAPNNLEVKASAKKEKVAQQTEPEKYPEGLDVQPILDDPRLPKHVLPEHYDLYLHPDLGIFQDSAAAPQPRIGLSF